MTTSPELNNEPPDSKRSERSRDPIYVDLVTAIKTGSVRFDQLAIGLLSSVADPQIAELYPQLAEAFETQHGRLVGSHYCEEAMGAAGLTDRGEFFLVLWDKTIPFDVALARDIVNRLMAARDAALVYLNAHQQRTFIPRLYGVGTSLLDAVDTELDRIGRDGTPDRPPSEWFFSEVKRLSQLTAALEVNLNVSATATGRNTYYKGVTFGAVVVWAGCALALVLGGASHEILAAISAGAAGAFISVTRRMTRGAGIVDVDFDQGPRTLFYEGALRPCIGSIFAVVVAATFRADLVPAVKTPQNSTTGAIAFYSVFAFIAGFSEYFAQDLVMQTTLGAIGRKSHDRPHVEDATQKHGVGDTEGQ